MRIRFQSSGSRVLGALLASAAVHAAMAGIVSRLKGRERPPPQDALQVAVVEQPRPPPKEEPPKPPPPKPPPVKIARFAKRAATPPPVQPKTPQPPSDAPPPPSDEAKQNTPEPIVITGITMESTATQGTMSVGVGNTLYGTPDPKAKDPASVKPYKADKYAPIATVTEMPSLRERPNLRQYYPPEAVRKDFEGDVTLRVVIDSDGTVVKADVISDPGEGLGPAAVRAVLRRRLFNPARQNGEPVATTMNFVLQFILR